MCEYVSQDGKASSSIIFPSSSRSGMVSTRSPGWRSSLYSNVPVNRDATGGLNSCSTLSSTHCSEDCGGARSPLRPLGGAAGQLSCAARLRDPRWGFQVEVWGRDTLGPQLALCSQHRVAPASCHLCLAAFPDGAGHPSWAC